MSEKAPELTADEKLALGIIQPMLDCDFCLTCPDDAKDIIEKFATAIEQARQEAWQEAIEIVKNEPAIRIADYTTPFEATANLRRKIVWKLEARKEKY